MNYRFYLGIDMGKLTFDYVIIDAEGTIHLQGQVQNEANAISAWITEMELKVPAANLWEQTLICMEHSGYYNAKVLQSLQAVAAPSIWIESALQIKRSIGIQRGKNDRIDALRIAVYALDFQRKARLWKPKPKSLERLGLLVSHRDRIVKNLLSLKNTLKEEEGFVDSGLHREMEQVTQPAIAALEKALAEFERRIEEVLQKDGQLGHQAKIVASIPGFGKVIASKLILATHGFTQITDPRSLACYAGIAPFEHRSGTSLKGKTRVSHFANKDLKKMLHMAALVTIRKGNIMHDYFNRKVAEGKNKMSVINAIRNKLIHILLACIKNNTKYQKNFNNPLAVT